MNPILALVAAIPSVPPTGPVDPATVTPGPAGFFMTIALMLAVGVLAMSLMTRMSRLQARYQVREQLDREEAAARDAEALENDVAAGADPAEGASGIDETRR